MSRAFINENDIPLLSAIAADSFNSDRQDLLTLMVEVGEDHAA